MKKRLVCMALPLFCAAAFLVPFFPAGEVFSAEKIKIATPIKMSPLFFLPPMVALEKGFWQEEGVDAEWFPFTSGRAMTDAIMAKAINHGLTTTAAIVQNAPAGIPSIITAHLEGWQHWFVWVRADSRIKRPPDLKGAKIGFSRFRSLTDAYSVMAARQLGMEGEVKYVALGGVPQMIAALKAGTTDAIILTPFELLKMEMAGEIRRVVDMGPMFPRRWMELTLFATRDYIREKPDLTRRILRGILKANKFIMDNPAWCIEKIRVERGDPPPVAEGLYKLLQFSSVGTIDKEGLANVRNFMIEYNLVPKEKTPPVEGLFTDKFVPVR